MDRRQALNEGKFMWMNGEDFYYSYRQEHGCDLGRACKIEPKAGDDDQSNTQNNRRDQTEQGVESREGDYRTSK
jgi:hypothetical protein